jgi:hypothetical protein
VVLKMNRAANRLDRISRWNDKCVFECVWLRFTAFDRRWSCIWGLNIYNWAELDDIHHHPRRGCVGFYIPNDGKPATATEATLKGPAFSNKDRLDPFGDYPGAAERLARCDELLSKRARRN